MNDDNNAELARVEEVDDSGRELHPLSQELIVSVLEQHDETYHMDEDGDLLGFWNNNLFYFLLLGEQNEVLQVRGQWDHELTKDQLGAAIAFANEWNTNQVWPKAYVRVGDDAVEVYGEWSADLEYGVTLLQLDQFLSSALAQTVNFFSEVAKKFPDATPIVSEEENEA